MNESPSKLRIAFGCLLLLVGISVFAIRLQHPGPYDFPEGGNLVGGVLSLLIGLWLVRAWLGAHRLAPLLTWLALALSPVALFLGLYAALAELEEVVVLKATEASGRPVDLRLWIVDHGGAVWVTMPQAKAEAHGLDGARVELVRGGEARCVVAALHADRETVNGIHRTRHGKYAVQRMATVIGMFGRDADPETVALRLDPCPPG